MYYYVIMTVKVVKKLVRSTNFWPIVIVIVFGLLAASGLIGSGYFNMHDDLQMMRQLEMEKCFLSLQIPCRWVPDMGYGFGFPLFNFYPPLPYLVGEGVRLFGFSFVDTVKVVAILSFVLSGITMYFLARKFFPVLGAIISAVFYIWAPYHSVDIYVRGAMNESWALVFFPLTFLFAYRLITEKKDLKKLMIFLALSWAGLLVSHNLMAMIFAPLFGAWCLLWIVKRREYKKIVKLVLSGLFAVCLVAFFTLPVVLEQKYTHADTLVQGYYEYNAHFASFRQLLVSRFWGYGPSVWEVNDGLSFQVGVIHWVLSLVVAGLLGLKFLKKRKIDEMMLIVGLLFIGGWFAVFMIHSKSTPIWMHISTLRYVQFPWRFLTLAIFCFSFLAGSVVSIIPKKFLYLVVGLLLSGILILDWNYFLPEFGHLGPLTDTQKFSGAAWGLQQTAGIYDYLPIDAKTAPKEAMKNLVEILKGSASVSNIVTNTNWDSFDINVTRDSEVRLGIFKFPDWRVFVDGKETAVSVPKDEEWGRMHINIPAGKHSVYVRLYDTPIRTAGNVISLISWIGLGGYLMLQFKRGRELTARSKH